jgi:hypothetical protein
MTETFSEKLTHGASKVFSGLKETIGLSSKGLVPEMDIFDNVHQQEFVVYINLAGIDPENVFQL